MRVRGNPGILCAMHASIGILGAGRVARALTAVLRGRGQGVQLWARDPVAAKSVNGALPVDLQAMAAIPTVILCVADDAVTDVATQLAAVGAQAGTALHTSGFLGADALAPLTEAGRTCGWLHPLASISEASGVAVLDGAPFCVGGAPEASRVAHDLATTIGGRPFTLRDNDGAKARYHGAASLLAGGTIALFDAAEQLFAQDVEDQAAAHALLHLLDSVRAGLAAATPAEALTGPAARGDQSVIDGHLAAMDADTAHLYTALVARMRQLKAR